MAASLTPDEASKELRALSRALGGAIRQPMNEARKAARKDMVRRFRSENPGRSVFGRGRKSGKPPLIIKSRAARAQRNGDAFRIELRLIGFAALIEEGGRTKRHAINPRGRLLKFEGRRGTVFARRVQHPGGKLPKNPIGRRAVDASFRDLTKAVDKSLTGAVRARGLN